MISIIIPNYNTPKEWLLKSITSALNQTYSDIEIIVIDDGSIEPFSGLEKELGDKKIQWVDRKYNSGVSATRNYGASIAKGDWLAFLDADDWWEPNKLEAQLKAVNMYKVRWVYTSACIVTQTEKLISILEAKYKGYIYVDILTKMIITGSCSSVMVHKKLFSDLHGFDTKNDIIEDWDLWMRLAKEADVTFVNKPLVNIRSFSNTSRGMNSGKIKRLKNLQSMHWGDIEKHKLQSIAKSHFYSVKAKIEVSSKNYVLACFSSLLSVYYSRDLSKFGRAYLWIKNTKLFS